MAANSGPASANPTLEAKPFQSPAAPWAGVALLLPRRAVTAPEMAPTAGIHCPRLDTMPSASK